MKKRYLLVINIAFCLIIITFFAVKKEEKSFVINGVKYSTTLNGSYVSSFPASGNYEVNVECENAIGEWNYSKWVVEIYEITGKVSCNISFTSTTPIKLNSFLIEKTDTDQGNGKIVHEIFPGDTNASKEDTGYRYEGKNPNNYIYFNNELWRIIGVFDSNSHGIADINLVKIIKNDSIGGIVWNNEANGNWSSSSLYRLLNDYYYTATDGANSGYCYNYVSTTKNLEAECTFSKTGIQTEYREMIQDNVVWYIAGVNGSTENEDKSSTAHSFYYRERYRAGYTGGDKTATGNIGLMYASDYGYSVLSSSCARTTALYDYGTDACAGNSWLKKELPEWTITNYPLGSYVYAINDSDNAYKYYSYNVRRDSPLYGHAVRPVLYLKSNVVRYAGDGSISNPYQIRLES